MSRALSAAFACGALSLMIAGCSSQPAVFPSLAEERDVQLSTKSVPLAWDELCAGGVPALRVESSAFKEGQPIPASHAGVGVGEDASPPLKFGEVPAGTKSLLIVMEDPDAPEPKPFVHWVLFNVPPDLKELRTGVPAHGRVREIDALQGSNSRGNVGYFGPKPPAGDPPHHYHFQVFALSEKLAVAPHATRAQVLAAAQGKVLAAGRLMGTFQVP